MCRRGGQRTPCVLYCASQARDEAGQGQGHVRNVRHRRAPCRTLARTEASTRRARPPWQRPRRRRMRAQPPPLSSSPASAVSGCCCVRSGVDRDRPTSPFRCAGTLACWRAGRCWASASGMVGANDGVRLQISPQPGGAPGRLVAYPAWLAWLAWRVCALRWPGSRIQDPGLRAAPPLAPGLAGFLVPGSPSWPRPDGCCAPGASPCGSGDY